jgi:outer membrane protein
LAGPPDQALPGHSTRDARLRAADTGFQRNPNGTPTVQPIFIRALAALALASASLHAAADGSGFGLKLGYADIHFNTRSGDLMGPPGTTPPGVQASVQDSRTMALVGELPLTTSLAAVVQLGVPPVVRFNGAGAGAALGEVGSARAWFPAVLLGWKPQPWGAVQPYLAAGMNATFFTDTAITPAYTAAFAGSASRTSLKRSFGPVFKLGAELRLDQRWSVDVAYARYGIKTTATITTATPGLGDVVRTVNVKADPDVLSAMLGYRF